MNTSILPKNLHTNGMVPEESTHKRIRVLAHRWLPVLLRRVGVGPRACDLLRERFLSDDELRARLEVLRSAALVASAEAWSKHDRQAAELGDAAAAIAGQLAIAIELDATEPEVAQRSLARAGEQLVGLLVVGEKPHFGSPIQRWWERLRERVTRARPLSSAGPSGG
jgi:hypothetical protein